MTEFALNHPALEGQNLTVRNNLAGTKLLQNGTALKAVKGRYTVRNNAGQDVTVRLKVDLLDMAVPKVFVNDEPVVIAPPLGTAQKIWVLLPLVLIVIGGALGGAIGAGAAYFNAKLMRDYPTQKAYVITGLVSLGALLTYFALATVIVLLIGEPTPPSPTY